MSDLSQHLIVGQTYYIVDWYGMMGFKAVYRGIAKDKTYAVYPGLLVFERDDEGFSRFAGVIPEANFGHDYKTGYTAIGIHLRASYYGESVKTLKHVAGRHTPPEFALSP